MVERELHMRSVAQGYWSEGYMDVRERWLQIVIDRLRPACIVWKAVSSPGVPAVVW